MRKNARGFTLVELLVVIAIIAILAAVVVLIINPLELMRRSRDAARLTDLANLQQAINVAAQEATGSGVGILCFGQTGNPTPGTVMCQGNTNTDPSSTRRNADGTGWVKVNLSSQQSVSVPTLPVDPINNSTYNYTYASDGQSWEIDAVLESQQQINAGRMSNDGGNNPNVYEVGSNLLLLP